MKSIKKQIEQKNREFRNLELMIHYIRFCEPISIIFGLGNSYGHSYSDHFSQETVCDDPEIMCKVKDLLLNESILKYEKLKLELELLNKQ